MWQANVGVHSQKVHGAFYYDRAVAANEKKAANKAEKEIKASKQREEREAVEWADGAKSTKKKDEAEQRRQEELTRKKEREALLAAEEKGEWFGFTGITTDMPPLATRIIKAI